MTQEEPKEDKAFDSIEQLSKIAQDLVRQKTEQKPLKWCSQCGHKCPLPPQRTWVGLTDEEIQECYNGAYKIVQGRRLEYAFYKTIEAKLKQKNGYAKEKNT